MKKILVLMLSDLQNIVESKTQVIFVDVNNRVKYEGGEKTDQLEAVVIGAMAHGIGEIQIMLKPDAKLKENIDASYDFAMPFYLKDLGVVTDVKIGIYNGSLTVKVFVDMEG